jgi:thiamine-phosphate pyrophosphorylase
VCVASIIAPLTVSEYLAATLINVIRYAITGDPSLYASEAELLQQAARWAAGSINFVQLRAKHLDAGPLTALARKLIAALGTGTKLLINGRADVAIASGAAGVHLTAAPGELTPPQVRRVFALAGRPEPTISISCHTLGEVERAHDDQVDFILFGPVFEKRIEGEVVTEGVGLEMLQRACEMAPGKVLALGGITEVNTHQCVEAAAGIAGIRLFN